MFETPKAIQHEMLSETEAAQILRISVRTLQSWRVKGNGPRFAHIGRAVRYPRSELERWIEQRTFAHTSAADAAKVLAGRKVEQ
jgi:excisionase family DNA binding protein